MKENLPEISSNSYNLTEKSSDLRWGYEKNLRCFSDILDLYLSNPKDVKLLLASGEQLEMMMLWINEEDEQGVLLKREISVCVNLFEKKLFKECSIELRNIIRRKMFSDIFDIQKFVNIIKAGIPLTYRKQVILLLG